MRKIMKFLKTTILIYITTIIPPVLSAIKPDLIEHARHSVVTINTRTSLPAYSSPLSNVSGTGFIADKSQGIIVTNHHVVGSPAVGDYLITFFNGQEAKANVIFYDLWQDFAILKVDPTLIPNNAHQISFSKSDPKLGQEVYIVGNNEGKDFSFHNGYLSSLYDIQGLMPQHSYIVNLNSVGGSSGSPLLNDSGEAIGIHYGGRHNTYGLALKGNYISKAIDAIKLGKEPARHHIGAITELYSLDKAVKYRNFPEDVMKEYINKYPDYRNKAIVVDYLISGSPAANILQSGDIIWTVNGRHIGSSLFELDDAMDKAGDNKIELGIYRGKELLSLKAKPYNVNNHKVNEMIVFGGATFFLTDDVVSAKSGIPVKSLSIANVQNGSSFSVIPIWALQEREHNTYRTHIKSLSGKPINNLEDLKNAIPELLKKKFVTLDFINYQPYAQSFDWIVMSTHDRYITDITLDNIDSSARFIKFNPKTLEWDSENIVE